MEMDPACRLVLSPGNLRIWPTSSEQLGGTADDEATAIYAAAYNVDSELYAVNKSLEAYEAIMDADTLSIVGTDCELVRFLEKTQRRKRTAARSRGGIEQRFMRDALAKGSHGKAAKEAGIDV